MQKFELEQKLVHKGLALATARNKKVLSDVIYDGMHEYGYTPAEIMMNALASCITINTQKFADKMKVNYDDLKVKVTSYRQEEPPKIVKMEYEVHIKTDADKEKLDKLIQYAVKYSTVYNTLKDAIEINGKVEAY